MHELPTIPFALLGFIVSLCMFACLMIVLFKFFGREIFFGLMYCVYVLQGFYIFFVHPVRWILLVIAIGISLESAGYFAFQLGG